MNFMQQHETEIKETEVPEKVIEYIFNAVLKINLLSLSLH